VQKLSKSFSKCILFQISSFSFIRKLKCKQIQVNKMMSCNSSQVIIAAPNATKHTL
jgi:hypothetical protein